MNKRTSSIFAGFPEVPISGACGVTVQYYAKALIKFSALLQLITFRYINIRRLALSPGGIYSQTLLDWLFTECFYFSHPSIVSCGTMLQAVSIPEEVIGLT
jgi:hypothetical protein